MSVHFFCLNSGSETADEIHYVILLRSRPAVALLPDSPGGKFLSSGQEFIDRTDSWNTGFYDCLRIEDGTIVGVAYYPFDDLGFLGLDRDRFVSTIQGLDYVDFVQNRIMNIYLTDTPEARRAEWGGEQEFGECRLFVGNKGDFALSFQTSYVARSDLDRFSRSGSDAAHVEILKSS